MQCISLPYWVACPHSDVRVSSLRVSSSICSASGKSPRASRHVGPLASKPRFSASAGRSAGAGYSGNRNPLRAPISINRSRCWGTPNSAASNTRQGSCVRYPKPWNSSISSSRTSRCSPTVRPLTFSKTKYEAFSSATIRANSRTRLFRGSSSARWPINENPWHGAPPKTTSIRRRPIPARLLISSPVRPTTDSGKIAQRGKLYE
jgi:hypothetical protein